MTDRSEQWRNAKIFIDGEAWDRIFGNQGFTRTQQAVVSTTLTERQFYRRAAQTCMELRVSEPDSKELSRLTLRLGATFHCTSESVWDLIEMMAENNFAFDRRFINKEMASRL